MDLPSPTRAHRSSSTGSSSAAGGSSGGGGALSLSSPSQQAAAAAAHTSLQLLLREDALLQEFGLTESKSNPDQVAFPYAAALLHQDGGGGREQQQQDENAKQRADLALQDVERKLALVESLAVKLSRTRPEAVAGHLLRLHGYQLLENAAASSASAAPPPPPPPTTTTSSPPGSPLRAGGNVLSSTLAAAPTTTTTLTWIRDRADRLERQADVLDGVARRVETSLTRGLGRMEMACTRLERVLTLSSTLKSILRLQFESQKVYNYDLEDARDLTRAAASVAILEELLAKPELHQGIAVVDQMRPDIEGKASQVREAAALLLQEQYDNKNEPTFLSSPALPKLGTTLQVYFHLGELPHAVWQAVGLAHDKAEAISRELFTAATLTSLKDQAKKSKEGPRQVQKKLQLLRAQAAQQWSSGLTQVTLQVRNLQRVLSCKTDPVSRQVFGSVVAAAPTPEAYAPYNTTTSSIFALFWARLCKSLAEIIELVLTQDNGKYVDDVAALYPSVRTAAMELIGRLQETQLPAAGAAALEDGTAAAATLGGGILGGSSVLEDDFLGWSTTTTKQPENPQAAPAADSWTRTSSAATSAEQQPMMTSISLPAVFQSSEWRTLQSNDKLKSGLYPLQQAFVVACTERLSAPLQYMFPEHTIPMDDEGGVTAAAGGLPLLPSKYDVQRFDENIRSELSLADPREGGGDVTLVSMIAECVVRMISYFCQRAKNALSGVVGSDDGAYLENDWSMTAALTHDRKVAAMMYTLQKYLKDAPEKTFVAPYHPATSAQHEEAAKVCQTALVPALVEIEKMVKQTVLGPLCKAVNKRLAVLLAKMHSAGVYMERRGGPNTADEEGFVQKNISPVLETIAQVHFARFPPEYSTIMASKISTYTIYAFLSNVCLIRPLGGAESTRLQVTQDLADLEMALEQLLPRNNQTVISLAQIDNGKPYAELRAARQMLFWTGLETGAGEKSAQDVFKLLMREVWMKDVRPSTIFHYLFSFAPSLLSSPHVTKRMRPEDYVAKLVQLDGSVEEGEDFSWMTTMACCDSYQQRASAAASGGGGGAATTDGDARIPQILMILGQELMRRRDHAAGGH